jgi:squalene-hopene/tetraprenyl-beta-curcumene cyclase
MNHRLLWLSVVFALFFAPVAPASTPEIDFEYEIDLSVHWLREHQDLPAGSYGGTVEGTSWVLRALHDGPRHYRTVDGPFVTKALAWLLSKQRPDGSIADDKATGAAVASDTALAVMALKLFADESNKAALAKALAFVGSQKDLPAPDASLKIPEAREGALALAEKTLAARAPDKSWDGPRGKVIETAKSLVVLSAVNHMEEAAAPPKAAGAAPTRLPKVTDAGRDKVLESLARGGAYLLAHCKDGKFEARAGKPDAGITALAIGGLQCLPEPRSKEAQDAIDKGLAWLVSLQKPRGAIDDGELSNYVTSAAILALARAKKPQFEPVILKARDFLMTLQADEAEGYSPDHPFYGGNSYGDEERPDLSNVQMALEALSASGLEKGNAAYKRALVFLSRCQNRSESNTLKLESDGKTIVSGDDGGGVYTPGVSKAGTVKLADGREVPRSYGSMSYALLKSYIFAGLPKDDPRMVACWEWLRKNYTLDVNPGFESSPDPNASYQGLFYYFHTMAKALDMYGEETIVDAAGKPHAWRTEFCGRMVGMQSKEGSWKNENATRWWEGMPVLVTAYAMLSLDAAMPH